jgi:hypothetical protein
MKYGPNITLDIQNGSNQCGSRSWIASAVIHITFRQENLNRFPSHGRELEIYNVFGEKVVGIKMSVFQESYSHNISTLDSH